MVISYGVVSPLTHEDNFSLPPGESLEARHGLFYIQPARGIAPCDNASFPQ